MEAISGECDARNSSSFLIPTIRQLTVGSS